MDFNLEGIKKHPYAVGSVVIIGGVLFFYILSGSSSSSATSASGSGGDYLSTYAQLAQVQSAASVQSGAQQVALQQSQQESALQEYQTNASLQATQTQTAAQLAATLAQIQGQTTQSTNQYQYAVDLQSMQDQVLEDQINAGVTEDANNNATNLGATVATLQYQSGVASQSISAATQLALAQQNDFETNVDQIIPLAGQQKNSALDATNQTSLFESILSNGNPGVATAGVSASASTAASGNSASAANVASISSGVSKIISGLLG